jgi:hypothetical protein
MHWAELSLTSAFFLGFYDICQKHVLRRQVQLAPATVQAWFSIYLLVLFAPPAFFSSRARRE